MLHMLYNRIITSRISLISKTFTEFSSACYQFAQQLIEPKHSSLPAIIRKITFDGIFTLMLGIHATYVPWTMTNINRVDYRFKVTTRAKVKQGAFYTKYL